MAAARVRSFRRPPEPGWTKEETDAENPPTPTLPPLELPCSNVYNNGLA